MGHAEFLLSTASLRFPKGQHVAGPAPGPENCLLSGEQTRFVQLGNSVSKCVTWVGTVTYMAPERIAGGNQGYGLPSDIWSLGVTVMECALGRFPYQAQARMQWYLHQGLWHRNTAMHSHTVEPAITAWTAPRSASPTRLRKER